MIKRRKIGGPYRFFILYRLVTMAFLPWRDSNAGESVLFCSYYFIFSRLCRGKHNCCSSALIENEINNYVRFAIQCTNGNFRVRTKVLFVDKPQSIEFGFIFSQ